MNTPIIEYIAYDWTWFLWTGSAIMLVALLLGVGLAFMVDDGTAIVILLMLGALVAGGIGLLGGGNAAERYEQGQIDAALAELGYTSVEESDEGYNQYTASKDGQYVRLALTTGPEDHSYYVVQIQE